MHLFSIVVIMVERGGLRWLVLLIAQATIGQAKKPNIIFVLTDDQGSADLKFRNPDSEFITDNIDNLAAQSVRLSNYYICAPHMHPNKSCSNDRTVCG